MDASKCSSIYTQSTYITVLHILCFQLHPKGFFRRNGACGYVLKPALMRKEDPGGTTGGSAPYSPYMEVTHPDVPSIQLEIEVRI